MDVLIEGSYYFGSILRLDKVNWGPYKQGFRAPLKGVGADVRMV